MEALYLKSKDLTHGQICDICDITRATLASYLKAYVAGGVEELKELNYEGRKNELLEHSKSIEGYFTQTPPRSLKEARAKIEELTGIRRSLPQIWKFFRRMEFKYRKIRAVPGKALTPEKRREQDDFVAEKLSPRVEEAKRGERNFFFMDAAHFVHEAFLGNIWSKTPLFIPSPSGRNRHNVIGALNITTKEIVTVSNDEYINSESVCHLLAKLAIRRCDDMPITVVLDNAKYQRCEVVEKYAHALKIELMFLPSYSPNLNLIERLWKYIKKTCLYSRYYEKFTAFKQAIMDCLENQTTEALHDLETLLTCKFQSFNNVKILN